MFNGVGIVHTGRDRLVAAQIAIRLRRLGIDVWVDPETLVHGWMRTEAVIEALDSSKVILYLCSSEIEKTTWVAGESHAMLNHRRLSRPSGPRVVPVIVEKCTLPPQLAHIAGFDLTTGDFDQRLDELAASLAELLRKRTIFVCHSSHDKAQVGRIVHSLRRRRNLDVWYDSQSMKAGGIIRREIEAGISKADYLIAVLSNHAIDAIQGWIGFELDQAYERERQRNTAGHYFTIPVLLEPGLKVPGWLSSKMAVHLFDDFDAGVREIVRAVSGELPAEM